MTRPLLFLAGRKALAEIRENGLCQERVKIVAGAAGGPKWLILHCLDQALFGSWFTGRKEPLFLVGASAGAWRFAAVAQANPKETVERFGQAYINQVYQRKPTAQDVSREGQRILDDYLNSAAVAQALEHPFLRLNILAVRSRTVVSEDRRVLLTLGLAGAAAANLFSRSLLRFFFERALFYDPRDLPPFFSMKEFPINKIPLHRENLKSALLASGSIPLVMSGVSDIPGASAGVYRDGGILDYQLDLPYNMEGGNIVLYPHFLNRIIPGWFDKQLAWRKPQAAHMENILLVSPSPEFTAQLPNGKIPDRDDFHLYRGRDRQRIADWNTAVSLSQRLADDFMDAVESGSIRNRVQPLS